MEIYELGLSRPLPNKAHNVENKKDSSHEELKEACKQFEAIFLNYMLQKMRDTVPKSGFFDQGIAFDIVQSMHDEALTEELAKGQGIGLAQQLYKDLSKYLWS